MSATISSTAWRPASSRPMSFQWGRESGIGADKVIDWVLRRNRSFSPRQLVLVYLSLCLLTVGIASMFWWQGARMVMPFAWLELFGVGAAIFMYSRHAGDRECIALRGDRLTVEHVNGSHVERVEFQPAWVRVEPEHDDRSLIELSGQGRRIAIGRFVRPEHRPLLAEELRFALRRWRAGAP